MLFFIFQPLAEAKKISSYRLVKHLHR